MTVLFWIHLAYFEFLVLFKNWVEWIIRTKNLCFSLALFLSLKLRLHTFRVSFLHTSFILSYGSSSYHHFCQSCNCFYWMTVSLARYIYPSHFTFSWVSFESLIYFAFNRLVMCFAYYYFETYTCSQKETSKLSWTSISKSPLLLLLLFIP